MFSLINTSEKYWTSYLSKYFISLQEAIGVLDEFITSFKTMAKVLNGVSVAEKMETSRESTFKMAFAFEKFVLNYSKLHLIEKKYLEVIESYKIGKSEHRK